MAGYGGSQYMNRQCRCRMNALVHLYCQITCMHHSILSPCTPHCIMRGRIKGAGSSVFIIQKGARAISSREHVITTQYCFSDRSISEGSVGRATHACSLGSTGRTILFTEGTSELFTEGAGGLSTGGTGELFTAVNCSPGAPVNCPPKARVNFSPQ
jgi:hypothetical protein